MNDVLKTDIESEMEVTGCIELFHPTKQNIFYVFEQKRDLFHRFVSLEEGMYCFFISSVSEVAVFQDFDNISLVFDFLSILIDGGWMVHLDETPLDIPKKNLVKWQLCRKIR
jgi:hypothetical protein